MGKSHLLVLSSAFILGACSVESQKSTIPIGKFDTHPKGYIVEDLPQFSSTQMKKQQIKNLVNPALKWQHLDEQLDRNYGVSSDKAYEELELTQSKEIVVAVIDSGVDHRHEDLKDVMWVNSDEIPDNGKDDDGNGYVDDIYGWNFLGGASGANINEETLEETRIYGRLLKRLQNGELLSDKEEVLYTKVKELVETNLAKYTKRYTEAKEDQNKVVMYLDILKVKIGLQDVDSRWTLEDIESEDEQVLKIKKELLELWDKYHRGFEGITSAINSSGYYVNVGYNINFDARAVIVQDDPSNFGDIEYGNPDVIGPDASHGTHVAGIIAAKRNNELGMDGLAANVKIMALRAIPNGDERDKDVALAVRYAVDNGADIINMSFGKKFSPYKAEVDAAFEYAAKKGVLLIHAAGNSSLNIDGGDVSFPNHYKENGKGVLVANTIPNWIEVGSNTKRKGLSLISSFSNYGAEAVTLFSPGSRIYSTIPNNRYAAFSGTSMAAPVAAGVAAMLMSEFPTMKAFEAKSIIEHTVSKPDIEVRAPMPNRPRADFRIPRPFSEFCSKDGIINAYESIKFAQKLAN